MAEATHKITLVRIKRKRLDDPIDAFWLEQNAPKRHAVESLPFHKLAVDESAAAAAAAAAAPAQKTSRATRTLFRKVETIKLEDVNNVGLLMDKIVSAGKQRKAEFKKQTIAKTAEQQHKDAAKAARYRQVWNRRRPGRGEEQDAMQDAFHLYDVIREERDEEKDEDEKLLRKYRELLEECMPEEFGKRTSAAASSSSSGSSKDRRGEGMLLDAARPGEDDEFVYDVYAQHGQDDEDEELYPDEDVEMLSTLRVTDYGLLTGGGDESRDSDYDSADSNREDHPFNDYPEEEDDGEEDEDDSIGGEWRASDEDDDDYGSDE